MKSSSVKPNLSKKKVLPTNKKKKASLNIDINTVYHVLF